MNDTNMMNSAHAMEPRTAAASHSHKSTTIKREETS